MSARLNYTAMNIHTGESITGTSQDLAEKLQTSNQMIYHYAIQGRVYRKEWLLEPIESEKKKSKAGITIDLWEKWDRRTKPFKEVIKRKYERMNRRVSHE